MGGGLKSELGVSDPAKAGSDKQSKDFQAAFQAELGAINGHLQYTAVNAEASRHDPMAARREALTPAFQSALAQIDPANPSKAKGAIDKVIANAKAVNGDVTKFRKEVEKAFNDWKSRQPKFDEAIHQVEELEKWEDPKAAALRGLVDGIRKLPNDRKYAQACLTFDQLLPKLKPIYEEYLKQKEAKKKYDAALQALQPKLTEATVSRYAKLKPMQDDMATVQKNMEEAAQKKNFVEAVKIVADLGTKVGVYAKALAELEQQKKAYDAALAPLQPRLVTGPQPHAKLEPMHQELDAARGKMEEAAQKEDYVAALKFAQALSPKLDAYEKAVTELEKQKKAYEEALAPVKEKLSKTSESKYPKLEALRKDIPTLQGQMETAAQGEDYAKALELLKGLSAKVEAFTTALAELEKKKKAYEDLLAPIKEELAQASGASDGNLTPLQKDIVATQKQMEAAATEGDYEQAAKLCATLPAKLAAKAAADDKSGESFDIDWESSEFGKWGDTSRLKGGFKIKAKGKGTLTGKGGGKSTTGGATTNAGVKGEIELAKQKGTETLHSLTIKEIKETFNAELSAKGVDISFGVKVTFESKVPWLAPVLTGKLVLAGLEWKKLEENPDSFTVGGVEIGGGVQAKGGIPLSANSELTLSVDVTANGSVKLNWKVIAPELAAKFGTRIVQIAASVTAAEAVVIGGAVLISVAIIYGTFSAMAKGSEIRGLNALATKATNEFVDAYIAGFQGSGGAGGLGAQAYSMGQNAFANLKKGIVAKVPDVTDEEIREKAAINTKRGFVYSEVEPKAKQAIWQAYAEGNRGNKGDLWKGHVNIFGSYTDADIAPYL